MSRPPARGADVRWLAERHVAIIAALESGDREAAAEAVRVHAREAEAQVLTAGNVPPSEAPSRPTSSGSAE